MSFLRWFWKFSKKYIPMISTNKMKFYFLIKISKLYRKLVIVHLIGNSILKNLKTEHFMMFTYGEKKGFFILLLKRSKKEKITFTTSEIESWLNFGLETYDLDFFGVCIEKIGLKKKRIPRFLAIFENFESQFEPLTIKIFQIWKKH